MKVRCRSVSTICFIDELYKLDMLKSNKMKWCIQCLVDSGATLLTAKGSKIERKNADGSTRQGKRYLDLSEYFKKFQYIVEH